MSGLTSTGFQRKRLAEIKTEIEQELKSQVGNFINVTPPSIYATIIGIFAEREDDLWELAENVYNSQYPDTAEGVPLDNVVQLNGITRLPATFSIQQNLHLFGTNGTLIPAGTVVSVDGNTEARFETNNDVTLVAGADEIQTLSFGATPVSGSFKLILNDETSAAIDPADDAAAVQTILRELDQLSEVSVSGSFAAGFTITFEGADGKIDFPTLVVTENTLIDGGASPVVITVAVSQEGVPQGVVDATAEDSGEIQAVARTMTVIETPVSGLDSILNLVDATVGRDVETDAQLRVRRSNSLAIAGAGTVEALRSALLDLEGVTDAFIFENETDVVDPDGRPPHSFEAVVNGGDDQEIIDTIFLKKPVATPTFGTESGISVDTQGFNHTINFSRPTEVEIYAIVNITAGPSFPVDGAALVEAAVNAQGNLFGIGGDIIVTPTLVCAVADIPGVLDVEILIGTAPAPTLDDNIDILANEIPVFDSSRTSVVVS